MILFEYENKREHHELKKYKKVQRNILKRFIK